MKKNLIESTKIFDRANFNEKYFLKELKNTFKYHYKKCVELKNLFDQKKIKIDSINRLDKLPFLPVKIFKELENNDSCIGLNKSAQSKLQALVVLFKTPNSANVVVVVLIVVVLVTIVEILFPRIVVIVLRRTPIVVISKTANHI